jgi:cobalt-precorrin-5B (C1)-methyltransferase
MARCAVRKDAGDDPDVTDGMPVVATVSLGEPSSEAVVIDGGDGVGRVTKPGLDQPVGNAAINRVPRQMIRDAVLDVCEELDYDPVTKGAVQVVISIPGGEERAKKTFNPKLGVEGGLSVLGTSGIVEPMSEQALKDTIAVELRQAFELQKQAGVPRPAVLLTPGNYGKDFLDAQGWSDLEVPVVKISNYVGDALALRGSDGKVTCIELRDAPSGDSLCGISVGMARKDAEALMDGCPMLWQYDEEAAWIVRADQKNELNSETLVVFFDENGRVNGAWYRASGS